MPLLELTEVERAEGFASIDSDLLYLLENTAVRKSIISVLGHLQIRRLSTFACLESSDERFRQMLQSDLGLDPSEGMPVRIDVAHLVEAWTGARERVKRAADMESEARAEGRPKELLRGTHLSMRRAYQSLHGEKRDGAFPSAAYLNWRLDQLEEGDLRAERLTEVVSVEAAGEDSDDVGLTLSKGKLLMRRGKTRVAMPQNPEALRKSYGIMSIHWEVIRLKHPDRPFLVGLTKECWGDMLEYLLGEDVFEYAGPRGTRLLWDDLLNYEHELRKFAIKLTCDGSHTLSSALTAARKDNELRTKYFVTCLALTPAPRRRSRSRSPRPKVTLTPKGKGKQAQKGKGGGKKGSDSAGSKAKNAVNRSRIAEKLQFKLEGKDGKQICIRYNQAECHSDTCKYAHACLRCGGNHPLFDANGESLCPAKPRWK